MAFIDNDNIIEVFIRGAVCFGQKCTLRRSVYQMLSRTTRIFFILNFAPHQRDRFSFLGWCFGSWRSPKTAAESTTMETRTTHTPKREKKTSSDVYNFDRSLPVLRGRRRRRRRRSAVCDIIKIALVLCVGFPFGPLRACELIAHD